VAQFECNVENGAGTEGLSDGNRKMTTSRRVLLILAASVLGFGGWRMATRVTETELEQRLALRTPVGSSLAQVRAVLDSLSISYSDLDDLDIDSRWSRGAGRYVMNASIQDLRRPHLLADGLFLGFLFDEDSLLISVDVHEVWTFL
jgi:hypothetical protein